MFASFSDVDDADADDSSAPRPAFPLPDNLQPPPGPPATAAHYLAHVRAQASALPSILTAATKSEATGSPPVSDVLTPPRAIITTHRAPSFTHADPHWQHELLNQYANLQDSLLREAAKEQHDHKNDSERAVSFVQAPRSSEEWVDHVLHNRPSLSFLRSLDYLALSEAVDAVDVAVPNRPSDILRALVSESRLAEWVYSLLLFFSKPLFPDTAATARSLYQKATAARTILKREDKDAIAQINVVLTILGDYFGQGDLE